MEISWSEFKKFVVDKGLSIQHVEVKGNYWMKAFDGAFSMECLIPISDDNVDTLDFVANFKSFGNKKVNQPIEVSSVPAFASKTIGDKRLFKRVVGMSVDVTVGVTDILWTCSFPWVKFMAIEIANCSAMDSISLYVLDTVTGTYSTVPNCILNQFGFGAVLSEGSYKHSSEFDADLYSGLQIKIVYTSVSIKTVGVNFVMNEVKT